MGRGSSGGRGPERGDARAEPASILIVCTGNVCRSPLMERLLVSRLDDRLGAGATQSPDRGCQRRNACPGRSADNRRDRPRARPARWRPGEFRRPPGDGSHGEGRRSGRHRNPRSPIRGRDAVTASHTLHVYSGRAGTVAARPGTVDVVRRCRSARVGSRGACGIPSRVHHGADDVIDPYGCASTDYRRASDQMEPAVDTLAAAIVG